MKKILLVEDNENDVEMVLSALEDIGLEEEVVVTRDGREALDYLSSKGDYQDRQPGNPQLMLMDLKMPGMDGLELLKRVKSEPAFKKIPIVALTSSRDESDIIEGYNLGVTAYVQKPHGYEKFAEEIKLLALFWVVTNQTPPQEG